MFIPEPDLYPSRISDKIKGQKEVKKSGSIPLTNGSGSDSRRLKNRRIRIRNSDYNPKLVYYVPCSITDLCLYFVRRKLKFYGGNYDAFMKTRLELMEAQGKQYQWEQDQIAHMKVGIFLLSFSFLCTHC
jgi:hypothetical protein